MWSPFRCFHVQFVVDPLIILKKKMSGSQPKRYHCPVCGKSFSKSYDIAILTPAKNLTNVLFVTLVILPRFNFYDTVKPIARLNYFNAITVVNLYKKITSFET